MKLLRVTALLMLTAAYPAYADSDSCKNFVTASIDKAMVIFHDPKADVAHKRKELAAIFKNAVDTDWIGQAVLGKYWKTATPEQQQTYLSLYREYLASSYISKFDSEDGMNVSAIKIASFVPAQSGGYEAKTLIDNKEDADVHVDYLLDDSHGDCKVHDVKVEGVSLLISQRSEFGNLAANKGVAGIIAIMQQQLKENPPL